MTRAEYEGWKALTNRSQYRWMQDLIAYANRGTYLFFRGGENGNFIEVQSDGTVIVGSYEDALPHIGEACFKTELQFKRTDQKKALQAVYETVPQLKGAMVK